MTAVQPPPTRPTHRVDIFQLTVHAEPDIPVVWRTNIGYLPQLASVSIGDPLREIRVVADDPMVLRRIADAFAAASRELEANQFAAEEAGR